MININKPASNAAILASLRQLSRDIARAQTRIGTGYRINAVSDGAKDWASAQSIRTGISRQDTSNDAMTVAKARVDIGIAGLDKITDLLAKIQNLSDSLSPTATGATLASAQSEIRTYQTQINTVIQASGFQGRNALAGASETVTIGASSAGTAIRISMTGVDISAAGAQFAAAVAGAMTNATTVRTIADFAATALAYVADYRATLASFSASLDTQIDFQATLKSIGETTLGRLVDTDLDAESAKIAGFQVRQQLATQALAITNTSPKNILALFK